VPRGRYEKRLDDCEVLAARASPSFRDGGTGMH